MNILVFNTRLSKNLKGLLFYLLLLPILTFAQKEVPELWGQRIHDDAHVLKQETVDGLESKLKLYEDSTSNQIAVLLVSSLDGDVIEDYSMRVVEKWKLGKKDKDNGVLLLVAVEDHKMRIEVGQGLEGVLTDAHSSRIIRNELAPNFRRNDYDAGINAGVEAIIKAIGGEYKADDTDSPNEASDIIVGVIVILAILIFVGVIIAAFVKEFRSGGGKGGSSSSPRSRSSSWFSGSSGSSWSSGGSSWSGGGGSFGGGGSSGSW